MYFKFLCTFHWLMAGADVGYSLLFQASLGRDVVMSLDRGGGCYDLELFFPPLMLSCFLLYGMTSCHPGDSVALLCFSKWFAKQGLLHKTCNSKSVLWIRAESEREYELWVEGFFQLSIKYRCIWDWVHLWNNRHCHHTTCQDEESALLFWKEEFELNVIAHVDVSQCTWAQSLQQTLIPNYKFRENVLWHHTNSQNCFCSLYIHLHFQKWHLFLCLAPNDQKRNFSVTLSGLCS